MDQTMSADEFRRNGHAMVEWIASYYERVATLPVLSRVEPGEIRALLPADAPEQAETFDEIMEDVDRIIMPGITHWQSPYFFGFFPANASPPSVLGDMLSSGLGVQGMLWATSPACTELETHMLDWIVDLLALPAGFKSDTAGGGVIQDSASNATLCAVLTARERATEFQSNSRGCDGKLVAYTSAEAHSSIEKAVKIAGLGSDRLRLISVDEHMAMCPEALEAQIKEDVKAGLIPCFVCATVGTTSTLAIDPLGEIGRVCESYGVWLHVDAAHAGTAALCPEFRFIHNGLEWAHSYCFDPHKWMFTNFDCDCFYLRDRSLLIKTLSILPEYLRNQATESGAVIDYRDWHVPLGRRFRALKLWFVIRQYGAEGMRFQIRNHVQQAEEFSEWVTDDSRFELAVPQSLNLVCFRHIGGDQTNRDLMDSLNRSGELYLTHTSVHGRIVLRFSIGQWQTRKQHVEMAWRRICEAADKL